VQIPEPYSFILTWFAAIPFILWLAQSITRAIVKDFLILKVQFLLHYLFILHNNTSTNIVLSVKGPCPNCGTENTSFFGTILSVSSGNSINNVKCEK